MTWKQTFSSSVGRKVVMSLTGIFLILFLIVHVGLNASIWANDGGKTFNIASHFMGTNVVIRTIEVGLFLFLIIHIVQGLMLAARNQSRRGIGYAENYGNRGSRWYARSMGLLGTLVLLFLIVHLANFWVPSRWHRVPEFKPLSDEHVSDLFGLMQQTFSNIVIVIVYVLGCISLAYHLAHGFQSAFRTLGVHNKRYVRMLVNIGYVFSVVVCLAFAMMPITMYFHLVH